VEGITEALGLVLYRECCAAIGDAGLRRTVRTVGPPVFFAGAPVAPAVQGGTGTHHASAVGMPGAAPVPSQRLIPTWSMPLPN